jgi:hypothetical protein
LQEIENRWQSRLETDSSVQWSLPVQLAAKLASQESVTNKTGKAFTSFFKERGINLLLGFGYLFYHASYSWYLQSPSRFAV